MSHDALLVLGLLSTYGAAFGLDRLLARARLPRGDLDVTPYLWTAPLVRLALALILLLLAYALISKRSQSKLPTLVFLAVGGFLTFYQTPAFMPLWGHWLGPLGPLFELPRGDSLLSITSSFVGVMGLMGLVLKRPRAQYDNRRSTTESFMS